MKTGLVAATVVSTVHHPSLDGRPLLLVELEALSADGSATATGAYTVAVDTVDAGVGQRVLVLDEGSSARQILADDRAPVRAVIVGVVDTVDV